ncbi:MAG TPA: DJ-1/PfpI family protein [Natrialbaceae archaeon]|nr:DJ-1/PfpI family protein [Natrialbaceae archaeon]
MLDIEIVLFEEFDELDAVGPYEVLQNGARVGADLTVGLVTLEPTGTVTASHGLRVEPDGVLGDPDLLVVPGGGWSDGGGVRNVVEEGTLPSVVADAHEAGTTVASVCTGAMILATGGVLDGRPATTHRSAIGPLAEYTETLDARVVDDGDVLTAGGVTSGIDLALHLLAREFDEAVADEVATILEYDPTEDVVVTAEE